jgi:hypothetical protein
MARPFARSGLIGKRNEANFTQSASLIHAFVTFRE